MKKTILSLMVTGLFASSAWAVDGITESQAKKAPEAKQEQTKSILVKKAVKKNHYPGLIAKLGERGIEITKEFNVSPLIKGYVIKQGGTSTIIYSAGDYVFSGVVFDPMGNNVSNEFNEKYIPKPDVDKVVSEIESKGKYVEEGKGDRFIYVFADPNCPHCEDFYKKTRQLVADGKLKIKWIQVGFLSPESRDKAAYILQAKDPVVAMQRIELGYAPGKASNEGLRQVAINQELMQKAGVGGTPGIIYKKDGKWVVATNGLPPNKILSTIDK